MIFVTVGTDLPFDRLIRVVDQWAFENKRMDVFAQIGDTKQEPSHIPFNRFLEPLEFSRKLQEAATVVSHAGMGTILTALHYGKPILVMPRRATLGEQRNEHQLATARRLLEMGKVQVAFDDTELRGKLSLLDELKAQEQIGAFASEPLLDALREFINPRALAAPGRHTR